MDKFTNIYTHTGDCDSLACFCAGNSSQFSPEDSLKCLLENSLHGNKKGLTSLTFTVKSFDVLIKVLSTGTSMQPLYQKRRHFPPSLAPQHCYLSFQNPFSTV